MDNNIKRVYGHNVVEMVQDLKTIEDKDKRTRQAYAIVKVMEILNPTVRSYDVGRLRSGRGCALSYAIKSRV